MDTNVAIVANGESDHATINCEYECTTFLQKAVSRNSRIKIFLDESGLIFDEYKDHLSFRGQPKVGDMFFKYLHDHMYQGKKVQLVLIHKNNAIDRGFDELPINQLDRSDRKFLAVAVVSGADIVNAVDTDWHAERALIDTLGITVQQLCPDLACS